ncbi:MULTISPECIES: anthranilate synthase component II [Pasteurellaceae]|uniref:anthranilate synthase component II n=1 Tax=Pasteurellaceae TaxID=712 RepID=UPI0035638F97
MNTNLLVVNNHDSFTYNLVELIRRLGVPFTLVNTEALETTKCAPFSHILISPGPDVPEAYPQLFAMLAHGYQEKSVLGVCLGHQTLCGFFGAGLYNLPQVRHGQRKTLQVRSDCALFRGLPQRFQVGLYHSWAVAAENFPPALQVTAVCEDNVIMAVQHRSLPLYGVQFHPESYMSEFGYQLLANWINS